MANDNRKYLKPELLARIGDLEMRARLVVEGFVSGMHRSPYHGVSVEFSQHKEYVAGDDLRHLDWRVYGRSDRYYIKQYEEETNLRVHIALDCSASMRYPEQLDRSDRLTKFEYAATLAASLAFLLTHQQDAAGLIVFDDEVRAELPPLSSQGHLRSLVAQLERVRLERANDATATFPRIAGRLHRRSMIALISDLLVDTDVLIPTMERIRHAGHEVVVFHVLDHDERTFPFLDNTLFEGIEATDQQVLVDPQALKAAYLDALAAHETRIRRACSNSRIEFVSLSTADPLDVALRAYLAARMHQVKAGA
ncbi:MAG: DUF58 domain-containing protein [Phycisphaerales bacterium]|nr:DUF58 domain-containing protein [Phycisphaerales bacterium]MCB9858551.1 DUF58 domain-containing protein [Phycisphaerales bacterium]